MDCDERGEAIAANRSSKGLKIKKVWREREREIGDRSKFFKRVRIRNGERYIKILI